MTAHPTSTSTTPANLAHPGLDGVLVGDTRLSRVDGAGGEPIISGRSVRSLAGKLPFEEVVSLLLAAAEAPAVVDRRALGEARGRAWLDLTQARGALSAPTALEALRAGTPLLLGEDAAAPALLGASAVLLAAWLRRRTGQAPVPPDPARSHAEDLVRMGLGMEDPDSLRPRAAALDTYLVAVVDHGLNASTFAARVVASTGASDLSAVIAGLCALSGPLHGGAPGPVLDMLDAVGTPEGAEDWIRRELAAGRRIMGLGHRVYRTRDPRAAVLQEAAEELASQGIGGQRLAVAAAVEQTAVRLLAEHKPERGLHANVELGTAVLLEAIGFPREAFSGLFACSRTAGWLAHAQEQRRTGRLLRPRLHYVGEIQKS